MNIIIKCRDKTLHRIGGDIEIEDNRSNLKTIKLFLISLFGNYHYAKSYIDLIGDQCLIFLPPEFLHNIPGYYWD